MRVVKGDVICVLGYQLAMQHETNDEADALRKEVEGKVIAAFKIFDHEDNNLVDIRDVGTVIRSLGCCPSEADLRVIIEEVQDEDKGSYIHLDRFLPIVSKIVEDERHPPASYDQLLQSCKLLDCTNKGHLTWEDLKTYMTTNGEHFTPEELQELSATFVEPSNQTIDYRDWITWLVSDDTC